MTPVSYTHLDVYKRQVENRPDWENSSEQFVLCTPWWIRSGHALDKYVVVGHFPTYNFARGKNTNLPIIDTDKRIIAVDGGCSVKSAGQINAFIINKDGESYSYDNVFEPSEPVSYTHLNTCFEPAL